MSQDKPPKGPNYTIPTRDTDGTPGFNEASGPNPIRPPRISASRGPRLVDDESDGEMQINQSQSTGTTIGNLPPVSAIAERSGNYMLTYGFPGAGKTVFQSHLLRWIARGGEFSLNVAKNDSNDASRIVFNNWMEMWDANQFPEATEMGADRVVELRFRATPKSGRKKALEFNILEMSGEDQRRVVPQADRPSEMMEPIRAYLANPRVTFLLVLVLDPAQPGSRNDILFLTLLDYLDANFPGLSQRMSLLLLLSKPDMALAQMRSNKAALAEFHDLQLVDRMSGDHVDFFFDEYTPTTIARLEDWPGKWATSKLRIGSLPTTTGGSSTSYTEVDFDDTKKIFDWIFEAFVGSKPGRHLPSWLDNWLDDPED